MKRTIKRTKDTKETRLRYKKIHGGLHFHGDGQVVKKGEILLSHPHELGTIIKAGFECLDTLKEVMGDEGLKMLVQPADGVKDRYNLINSITGAKLNEKPLTQSEAEKFGKIPEENSIEAPDKGEGFTWEGLEALEEADLVNIVGEYSLAVAENEWEDEDELRELIAEEFNIEIPEED